MVNDKSSLSFPGATLAIIIQMNIDTAVILSALIAVFYTWIGREHRPRGGGHWQLVRDSAAAWQLGGGGV